MSPCSLSIPSLVLLGSFALGGAAGAQSPRLARSARVADGPVSMAVVFEGIVLEPDGTPAAGVRVTSSAGGTAVTELDGRYRLAAEMPLDAESVQLDAASGAGGSGPTATTTLSSFASRGATPVDPLVLTLGANGGPRWLPTFGPAPQVSGSSISHIKALTVLDDGSRPALYAGGTFDKVGAVEASNIARWNGHRWSALGSGVDDDVDALAVYDDGSGPALYAAGRFTTAGGVPANHVAKWDGSSWSALGSGTSGWVHALTVYDDGSGPALYAAGQFMFPALRIAKWDGTSWSAVGGGIGTVSTTFVHALAVYDDGSGPALYAGGTFSSAGGVSALRIAKWDGSSWSALGSGLTGNLSRPVGAYALTVYDDGSGPALYVGGIFGWAGGVTASHIARWDGSSWAGLESGVGTQTPGRLDEVKALAVFDDGGGPELCAGGTFSTAGGVPVDDMARWDGSGWAGMGDPSMVPRALAVFRSHGVARLHAGGFGSLRKWNGASWNGPGNGLTNNVRAVAAFDDGDGQALYVGGDFTAAGNVSAKRIATWDGSRWSAPDGGVDDSEENSTFVRALAVFDDGGGPALYVGGLFPGAGGIAAQSIARWDGSSWSALGSGILGYVNALMVFDDGNGPALYAGGAFHNAGGMPADGIARWDGSSWSTLGSGVSPNNVNALAVFDDGSGPGLYAGGTFTSAGGVPATYIARWDGSSWSPLGDGMNGSVNALAVFDDGGGPQLYSGSNGAPHYIARWNGASWSAVHGGMNAPVRALTVFDDGNGAALYAGGDFTTAGGAAASRIARYDGTDWWPVSAGMDDSVYALAPIEDGGGPDLYVGSEGGSPDSGDGYLARYGLSPATDAPKLHKR